MSQENTINFYSHQRSDNPPSSIVLMLHGLGSNGRDLITLAPYWDQALPDTLFVSPDAPFPCDMVPPGYPDSFQWFSLQDRDPDRILAGVEDAAPIIAGFISDLLAKHNLPASKLALVGFSQGTMMSLYVGAHYKDTLAGVLGYSGALVWPPDTDFAKVKKLPVCLVHGEADDVVPLGAYHMARDMLVKAGFAVSGHTTPGLPHSIDAQGVEAGNEFLSRVLS